MWFCFDDCFGFVVFLVIVGYGWVEDCWCFVYDVLVDFDVGDFGYMLVFDDFDDLVVFWFGNVVFCFGFFVFGWCWFVWVLYGFEWLVGGVVFVMECRFFYCWFVVDCVFLDLFVICRCGMLVVYFDVLFFVRFWFVVVGIFCWVDVGWDVFGFDVVVWLVLLVWVYVRCGGY